MPLADIYSVIGYYLRRRPEIETYLARRRQAAEQVRQQNEARFNPVGIRARLLARRTGTPVMLRFAADENLNNDIVRGLLRRAPALDIVRIQDARTLRCG